MNKTYAVYTLDKYLITYPADMKVEFFSCTQYYGITFITERGRVDVICNKDMGNRLTYNLKDIGWHDIPFKSATFGYLPEGVTATEIGQDELHCTNR